MLSSVIGYILKCCKWVYLLVCELFLNLLFGSGTKSLKCVLRFNMLISILCGHIKSCICTTVT